MVSFIHKADPKAAVRAARYTGPDPARMSRATQNRHRKEIRGLQKLTSLSFFTATKRNPLSDSLSESTISQPQTPSSVSSFDLSRAPSPILSADEAEFEETPSSRDDRSKSHYSVIEAP